MHATPFILMLIVALGLAAIIAKLIEMIREKGDNDEE